MQVPCNIIILGYRIKKAVKEEQLANYFMQNLYVGGLSSNPGWV